VVACVHLCVFACVSVCACVCVRLIPLHGQRSCAARAIPLPCAGVRRRMRVQACACVYRRVRCACVSVCECVYVCERVSE